MLAYNLSAQHELESSISSENTDARMVGQMRLVLAISAFLAALIDPSGLTGAPVLAWVVFAGYIAHALVVWSYSQLNRRFAQGRLIHWLDVVWYALIVACTDGVHTFYFLFFLFAILTSSFRWGYEEGARVTVVSVLLFTASCGFGLGNSPELASLLLRATFLLTLGYMSVHWGGSKLELQCRLALLRDVSRLSNPRFGVDHTITSVLEKTREFFGGASCILVLRDSADGTSQLRTVRGDATPRSLGAQRIGADMALPLLDAVRGQVVVYSRPGWGALLPFDPSATYDGTTHRWLRDGGRASERLAELLDTASFISAPLSLRHRQGRIYVLAGRRRLGRSDALFLSHIGAQAFPVIDNIELVDRMASEAASQERRKIALDIHDTAIQPYIGLKMGLSALRHQAAADNPLVDDLDRLLDMAGKVTEDLRRFAGSMRQGVDGPNTMLLTTLQRQARQIREFYGIDFKVEVDGEVQVSDRLTAEVLQIVQEGLANVCKHTMAQRGCVRLTCADGRITVQIENECTDAPAASFVPRSIVERATALDGTACVARSELDGGITVVRVEIPV